MSRRKRERPQASAGARRGRRSRPPLPGRRATIRDVAERAGVSTATVSFVLNRNPNESITELVEGVDQTVKVELAPVKLLVRGSTARPRSKS